MRTSLHRTLLGLTLGGLLAIGHPSQAAAATYEVDETLPCLTPTSCAGSVLTVLGQVEYDDAGFGDFSLAFTGPDQQTATLTPGNGAITTTGSPKIFTDGLLLKADLPSKADTVLLGGTDQTTQTFVALLFGNEASVSILFGLPGAQPFVALQSGQPPFSVTIGFIDGTEVPVPAALPLLATGLSGLGLLAWRRRSAAQQTHGSPK